MFIIGIVLGCISLVVIRRELKAEKKRASIKRTKDIVNMKLNNNGKNMNSSIMESLGIGIGATAISLLDIYSNLDKHQDVLDVLEQRFPHSVGNATSIEWFNKIEDLISKGDKSVDTYISCFKGQASENIALELLRDHGINASLFESLTNKGDDIFVTLGDNSEVNYSVKCGGVDYIESCINKADSTHYIINSESYRVMNDNGDLQEYMNRGIEIIDGGYSNSDMQEIASSAFDDIHEAGDVGDKVPYIAIAIFGIKTFNNIKQFSKGKQTHYELAVNVGTDTARVGSMGIFSTGCAKIGGVIGTTIAPGIGTVVGGGIGAITGAIIGSNIFNWTKEKLKWGKIIKSIEYFGEKYCGGLTSTMKSKLKEEYFNLSELEKNIRIEKRLVNKYKAQLDPYEDEDVTISAVMAQECYNSLNKTRCKIVNSVENLSGEIVSLCETLSKNMHPNNINKQQSAMQRYLGELMLSHGTILNCEILSEDEKILMKEYRRQIKLSKNHPYRFNSAAEDIIEGTLYSLYNKETGNITVERNNKTMMVGIGVLIGLLGVILIVCNYLEMVN